MRDENTIKRENDQGETIYPTYKTYAGGVTIVREICPSKKGKERTYNVEQFDSEDDANAYIQEHYGVELSEISE